jgi:hypothetical protein
MKLTKKEKEELSIKIEKQIDNSYNLGKKYILEVFENEVISGIGDGYIGIKYSCLLNLIKTLRDEIK